MVLCTVLVILVYKDGWACVLYMAWNLLSWQSSNEKIVPRATKLVTLVSWGVVLCLLLLLFCQRKVSVPLLPPKPSICSAHCSPSPSIVSFTLYLLNHSWQLCNSWHLSLIPSYHLVKKKWGAVVLLSLPEGQAENEHLSSEQLFPNRSVGLSLLPMQQLWWNLLAYTYSETSTELQNLAKSGPWAGWLWSRGEKGLKKSRELSTSIWAKVGALLAVLLFCCSCDHSLLQCFPIVF